MNWLIFFRDGSMRLVREERWRENPNGVMTWIETYGSGKPLTIHTIREIGPRTEYEDEVIPGYKIRSVVNVF